MYKLFSLVLVATLFIVTGCETTRELTLNEDGSGKIATTIDMSAIIGMAKASGQGGDKLGDEKVDTSFMLTKFADSLTDLSSAERDLVRKGTVAINMNMEDEKFVTKLDFPFSETAQIDQLNKLSAKALNYTMKKQLSAAGNQAPPEVAEALPEETVDDYYTMTYSKGVIEKKLNADKYSKLGDDKGMQSMKEMSQQGLPISNTMIINLPRPAKKVEGKNAKLSEDKKRVTINQPMDDFFDDGKGLEFRIEY